MLLKYIVFNACHAGQWEITVYTISLFSVVYIYKTYLYHTPRILLNNEFADLFSSDRAMRTWFPCVECASHIYRISRAWEQHS